MRATRTDPHDVIIAGAGPVGLFLAGELALAGCSVLVLEREPDPRSPLKELPFGLRGLTVPTVEAFDRRGLLDALADDAARRGAPASAPWMQGERRPGGHFAGIQFFRDRIDGEGWRHRLPGPVRTVAAEMASIESVLAARAADLGVVVLRGRGVEVVEQGEGDVAVRAGGEVFGGRWLVGCDGGRSAVRKAAGIGFAGTEPEFTGYSIRADLRDPDALQPGRHHTATGMYMVSQPDTISLVDFDGGAFHRATPLTRDHVEAVLRRVSGADVALTALHLATTWTDRAFQATAYRRGRVLLAGDAAHVHSPLGGQGLNLGLGDAMNLGWKLAATVRGGAPAGLLDSYERERHPIGARVLDWSRAQVALMRPTPGTRALASIVRDLVETRDGATYFADRVWGVSLRHDLGEGHPLVGRSVPDFERHDGTRVGDLMRDGRGLLLDFEATPCLAAVAGRWPDLGYAAGDVRDRLGLRALLVRPDGIVAWASDAVPDAADATRAAARWFGEPPIPLIPA